MTADPTARAKLTLVHYFRTIYERAGLQWDGDNVVEVRQIVDDIVAAARATEETP